jgi:hypothetical protein
VATTATGTVNTTTVETSCGDGRRELHLVDHAEALCALAIKLVLPRQHVHCAFGM